MQAGNFKLLFQYCLSIILNFEIKHETVYKFGKKLFDLHMPKLPYLYTALNLYLIIQCLQGIYCFYVAYQFENLALISFVDL